MLQKVFWIALLGAGGAVLRFALAGLVQRISGTSFPAGTFVVNVLGCFVFGLIWPLAEQRLIISAEWRLILLVGFVGSFTTFSTLVFETGELMRDAQYTTAFINFAGQTLLGYGALLAGMALGKTI